MLHAKLPFPFINLVYMQIKSIDSKKVWATHIYTNLRPLL